MYLNYLRPGSVLNQANGYRFDVNAMTMADKRLYESLVEGLVASAQALLRVPQMYLAQMGTLNGELLAMTRAHELNGGNPLIVAPLTIGRWLEHSAHPEFYIQVLESVPGARAAESVPGAPDTPSTMEAQDVQERANAPNALGEPDQEPSGARAPEEINVAAAPAAPAAPAVLEPEYFAEDTEQNVPNTRRHYVQQIFTAILGSDNLADFWSKCPGISGYAYGENVAWPATRGFSIPASKEVEIWRIGEDLDGFPASMSGYPVYIQAGHVAVAAHFKNMSDSTYSELYEHLTKADSVGLLDNSPITALKLLYATKNIGENTLQAAKALLQLGGAAIKRAEHNTMLLHTLQVRSGEFGSDLSIDGYPDCRLPCRGFPGCRMKCCKAGAAAGSSQTTGTGANDLALNQLTDVVKQLVDKISGWEKPEGEWQYHFYTPVEDLPADMGSYKVENEGPDPYIRPFNAQGEPISDPIRLITCLAEKPLPTSLADKQIPLFKYTTSQQAQDTAVEEGNVPAAGPSNMSACEPGLNCPKVPNIIKASFDAVQDISYDMAQNFNLVFDKLDTIGSQSNVMQAKAEEVKNLVGNVPEIMTGQQRASRQLIEEIVHREVSRIMAGVGRENDRTIQAVRDQIGGSRKAWDRRDRRDKPRSKAGASGKKADPSKGGESRGLKRDSSALASPELGKREVEGRADSHNSTKGPPSPAERPFRPPLLDKPSHRGADHREGREKDRGGEPKGKGPGGKGSRRGSGQDHSRSSSSGSRNAANNRPASFPNNIPTTPVNRVKRGVAGGNRNPDHVIYDVGAHTRTFPAEDPRLRGDRAAWARGQSASVAPQTQQARQGNGQERDSGPAETQKGQGSENEPPQVVTLDDDAE